MHEWSESLDACMGYCTPGVIILSPIFRYLESNFPMIQEIISCNLCKCYLSFVFLWGYSSAGRAPALHAGGQEFESLKLHHLEEKFLMEQKIKNLTSILFLLLFVPLSAENKKVNLIESEAHAILIPGSGTYSKKISTRNKEAQQFFDQGLD